MKYPTYLSLLLGALCTAALSTTNYDSHAECQPWTVDTPDRIFVLSDIANEPDDAMSFVRLLAHSDLYTVEGMVAITSFWLPNETYPEQIHHLVDGYAKVHTNLQSHSNRTFPTAEYLHDKIRSGPVAYGMQAIKALEAGSQLSEGAELLIQATDSSPSPLYIQIWGGANTLASALWHVNRTRSPENLDAFLSKLRVYSISDQDDTGAWIRTHFPSMRYIASRHGFNQYNLAAWTGISSPSADPGGPNNDIVSQDWLSQNIQIGPLGALYPDVEYIMEGDSPALLFNFQTGLGDAEHPDWGSWGGRYTANPLGSHAQFADAIDVVVGRNNETFTSNKATIWRWRQAFQNEFAARIQWSLAPYNRTNPSAAPHPPVVVVNGECCSQALEMDVHVAQVVTLDASSSYSPDPAAHLHFDWFQYKDPSSWSNSNQVVPSLNFSDHHSSSVQIRVPEPVGGECLPEEQVARLGQWGEALKCPVLHVVLRVWDGEWGERGVERYRRVVLRVRPWRKGDFTDYPTS